MTTAAPANFSIARDAVFSQLIAGHALPFLAALDPFRLSIAQIAERIAEMERLGGCAVLLASTDDEQYDAVVPATIGNLQTRCNGTMILEHFRPKPGVGFRRASESSAVIMTRVLSAGESFFRDCRKIEVLGELGDSTQAERLLARVALSAAIVFGTDAKSHRYVSAQPVQEGCPSTLGVLLEQALEGPLDLLYLYSRHARLSPETVSSVREAVGPTLPVIASGCIRSAIEIHELRDAGASIVVVGSVLEEPDWRDTIGLLARAG
jgi:heptaprenylglyceryl phosphate synthase